MLARYIMFSFSLYPLYYALLLLHILMMCCAQHIWWPLSYWLKYDFYDFARSIQEFYQTRCLSKIKFIKHWRTLWKISKIIEEKELLSECQLVWSLWPSLWLCLALPLTFLSFFFLFFFGRFLFGFMSQIFKQIEVKILELLTQLWQTLWALCLGAQW